MVLDRSLRRAVATPVNDSVQNAEAPDEDVLDAAAVVVLPESDTESCRSDITRFT